MYLLPALNYASTVNKEGRMDTRKGHSVALVKFYTDPLVAETFFFSFLQLYTISLYLWQHFICNHYDISRTSSAKDSIRQRIACELPKYSVPTQANHFPMFQNKCRQNKTLGLHYYFVCYVRNLQ